MQFTLEIGKKGLRVRREILNASGFQREEALDVRGMEQAVVIMKREMTAMELVQAIHSLSGLAAGLLNHLKKVCDPCEHCEGGCPYDKPDFRCSLDENLLEWAGIPKGSRMDVSAAPGQLIFSVAEGFDLRDVPPEMKELFRQTNICLDELDGLLAGGSVIYAG